MTPSIREIAAQRYRSYTIGELRGVVARDVAQNARRWLDGDRSYAALVADLVLREYDSAREEIRAKFTENKQRVIWRMTSRDGTLSITVPEEELETVGAAFVRECREIGQTTISEHFYINELAA